MIRRHTLHLTRLSLFLFLCFAGPSVFSQCFPPTSPPTQRCQQAPLVCLQDICWSTLDNPHNNEPAAWCLSDNPPHHPQYYKFQALSNFVQIHIDVLNCHGQALCGLQCVITKACNPGVQPWDATDMVACDAQGCINQTMILAPATLVPGDFYWLMIDNDSDGMYFCEYQISYLQNVYLPDINEDLTGAYTNDEVVCRGQDYWAAVAEPELTEVNSYLWTGFPWAPGYHVSRYHDMHGLNQYVTIPDDAPTGTYQICVVGMTACDTTDTPQCFDLTIVDLDGVSDPVTRCPEEYYQGINWEGLTIHQPGMYTQSYMTPEGCPYDSMKQFSIFPEPLEGYIDTIICGESLQYDGDEYFNPGFYTLYYEGGSSYGCDSFATLELNLTYIEATASFHCLNGQFVFESAIVLAVPSMNGLQYKWYRNGNILVSTQPGFTTSVPGTYTLFVSYFNCEFPALTNPIVVDLDELRPDIPDLNAYESNICGDPNAVYSVVPLLGSNMRYYEWTVEPAGVPITLSDTLNSVAHVNWQGVQSGTICVRAVNHCAPGPDTCFDISLLSSPVAAFNMQTTACSGEDVTIDFAGFGSPNAEYFWNFSGGTVVSGGTGPGPHVISWNTPGMHTVALQVGEENCDTVGVTHDIFIENLGTPVISCNSTTSSVTFEWDPVQGAVNYVVNVLQGPMGTVMDDTSYVVSGLAAGTVVEIQVIASGVGACPPTSTTIQCIAQSCPPRMLQIQLPADTLCLGEVVGTIQLGATVDGNPAAGTWSGPGVSSGGVFDPNDPMAGPGVHTIVFMYSEGTCDYQRSRNIVIIDSPTATFNADAAICIANSATITYTGNAPANASFMWNFGSGVATGSGAGPYNVTWATAGPKSISLIVEINSCVSEEVIHMVDVQPAITAPSTSCFPTTNSVTIQWSMVPNATMYDVVHLFGPMGSVNGNQYIVNGLMPGDSVAIQITVSGNTLCPPVVVVASCVAQDCPAPIITIDPVDDICVDAGTGTVDLNVTVMNGTGSGMWSGPGVIDAVQGIFDPNVAGPGAHVIEYQYDDTGCSFLESITIDVYDPPVAVISNTDFILTCENQSELILDGSSSSGPGALNYTWSTSNGVIIGASNQATATAGAAGDYTLAVVDPLSGCRDEVSVTLTEDTGIPNADAGPDGLLDCRVDTAVLGGNSSVGPTITYAWSTADGTIVTDPTAAKITVSDAGTYLLTVTDTENGCSAVDQAVVTTDFSQPTAALTVSAILDCDTKQVTISSQVNPPGGTYSYSWSTLNGRIVSGDGTPAVVADRVGSYTLFVMDELNGCWDTITTQVMADPESISGINAFVDNPNCVGDNDGMIEILNLIGGTEPFEYAWSNQTSGSGLLFLAPGTYSVTVTDANGCTFTESYILPPPIPIEADLGVDLTADWGDEITITVSVTDPGTIADVTWEGIAPACPACLSNTFTAATTGNITVTVLDTNGCVSTDMLRLVVEVSRNVYIPNVFSPNEDGYNDIFTISGKILTTIEYFRVYDRWGSLVHEELNIPPAGLQGWDGTFKGKELDPGVYVYTTKLIHADGKDEIISGDVTLVR